MSTISALSAALDVPSTAATQITPNYRARVLTAASGVVPVAIAVPLLIRPWTGTITALVWFALYAGTSAVFWTAVWRHDRESDEKLPETAWAIWIALLFSYIPISAAIAVRNDASLGNDPVWIATIISVTYVGFQLSYLLFAPIEHWWAGIALVTFAASISAAVANPVISVACPLIVSTLAISTNRVRLLKDNLQHRLSAVEDIADRDSLTGLLNRRGLARVLDDMSGPATVLMIDLDNFKLVNDTRGYVAGDQVLHAVAQSLTARLPSPWVVGRQGGDEFVAVAPLEFDDVSDVPALLQQPVYCQISTHNFATSIDVSMSAGVTTGCAKDADRLLSEAANALREAKGRDVSVCFFDARLRERFDRSLELAGAKFDGTESAPFVAYAQTIHDDDGVIGCELLARWKRPDGKILLPDTFLPVMRENGTMPLLTVFMLRQAMQLAVELSDRPNPPFVAVNVPATQLPSPELLSTIEQLLAEYEVAPEQIMIEITESEHLALDERWEGAGRYLRDLGVKLAIDDFGSGYSSIERLQHLPITHLKFDRELLKRVGGPFDEIIEGVTRFGARSSIDVIAEGIEGEHQLAQIRALGLTCFQGYLFDRPKPLAEAVIQMQVHADAEVATN